MNTIPAGTEALPESSLRDMRASVLWGLLYYGAQNGFDMVAVGVCVSSLWLNLVKTIMLRQFLGCSLRKMAGNI